MATKTSKAPSGLKISRSKMKFTFSWKKGETYTEQAAYYAIKKNTSWGSWKSLNVGKSTTSKTVSLDKNDYYPYTSKKLTAIKFKVKGKAKDKKYSDVKSETYTPAVPNNTSTPKFELSSDVSNKGTFTWSVSTSDTNTKIFARTQYYTTLIKDTTQTDGSKISWSDATTGTDDEDGSKTISESVRVVGNDSYTRFIRVRSQGARGNSDFKYGRHVYAIPQQGTITEARAVNNPNNPETDPNDQMEKVFCSWTQPAPASHPVDTMEIQYLLDTPIGALLPPAGASWQTGVTVKYKSQNDSVYFVVDDVAGEDQCLWCRVTAVHDNHTVPTAASLAAVGWLANPEITSLSVYDGGFSIDVTHNSNVPDSFMLVMLRTEGDPSNTVYIGILEHDETSGSYSYGDINAENCAVGVEEIQGSYRQKTTNGITTYSVTRNMRSDQVWYDSTLPVAPTNVTVAATETEGTVCVTWDWTWEDAVCAQLSWSDHADAWSSTDDPNTYTIESKTTSWNISDLTAGVTYYIRVRLANSAENDATFSPWSKTVSINLASAPTTPVMSIDKKVVTEDGTFTVSWAYVSGDGTAQAFGEVCEATVVDGVPTPVTDSSGNVVQLASVTTAQAILMSVAEINEIYTSKGMSSYAWGNDETHFLVCRVTSASGQRSDGADGTAGGWSTPASISVAKEASAAITDNLEQTCDYTETLIGDGESTSFETVYDISAVSSITINGAETSSYTFSGDVITFNEAPASGNEIVVSYTAQMPGNMKVLTEMPIIATTSGAGTGGAVSLAIERFSDYHLDRPDGKESGGYAGETIALINQTGDGEITIDTDDLIGTFDDGAEYNLIVTVEDEYGQTASETVHFVVHWKHQAEIPSAAVTVDAANVAVQITPIAPAGYEDGDTVDIYRLSADKPELVIKGGQYGVTYVDPYPALGSFGGHRVVDVTSNGDYITADGEFAMIDLDEAAGDIVDVEDLIIDFGGERVSLTYNIELGNTWEKDFERTAYLGGSVQGDWNAAVTRDLDATAVTLGTQDAETIRTMRELAVYTGICHVRTPDGSSFAADVQVEEEASYDAPVVSFSLTIEKIDTEEYDGMTLVEWQQAQEG